MMKQHSLYVEISMQPKVKIGCNYEPKWFERRQTSGWYSGKNPPLDYDAMQLQSALLGTGVASFWKTKLAICAACAVVTLYFCWCYGVFA
jgi:hypothetical protein